MVRLLDAKLMAVYELEKIFGDKDCRAVNIRYTFICYSKGLEIACFLVLGANGSTDGSSWNLSDRAPTIFHSQISITLV